MQRKRLGCTERSSPALTKAKTVARCLRCGAGNEWIEGKVRDEPATPPALPDEAGGIVQRLERLAGHDSIRGEEIDGKSISKSLREAASLIERLAPRWISVEERLPAFTNSVPYERCSDDVLVHWRSGH